MAADNKIIISPEEAQRQQAIHDNGQVQSAIAAAECGNRATMFFMLLSSKLTIIYAEFLRFYVMGIGAVAANLNAIFCWRQAYLNHFEPYSLAKAIFETVCALATTAATIGVLAFAAMFGVISPAIAAGVLGCKTVFNTIAAIVFGAQAYRCQDPVQKAALRIKARDSALFAVACALATAAVVAVLIFAKPIAAILGIMAGVLGVAITVYKIMELDSAQQADTATPDHAPGSTSVILKTVNGLSPSSQPVNDIKHQHSVSMPAIAVTDTDHHEVEPLMRPLRRSSCA